MTIHTVYFSATDSTRRTVEAIAQELSRDTRPYNLIRERTIDLGNCDDIVIIGTPVYAGRVPKLAAERLKNVHGKGQKTIVVCVYGNRAYDDALLELCDIAEEQGFDPVAAAAFIAEHCIFPDVAASRPDRTDMDKIRQFAKFCLGRIDGDSAFDKKNVKGNRPYLEPAGIPIHPRASKKACEKCGLCAAECPAGAIDAAKPYLTDPSKCIACCRCIHVCPRKARRFKGPLYKIAGWKFVKDNTRRLEPEWF